MSNFTSILQIVTAVLLMIVILVQQKGTGLGGAFGGEGNVYRTKRGMEKFLHYLTIILAIIFVASAIGRFFI